MKVYRKQQPARDRGVYVIIPLPGACDVTKDFGDKQVRCPNRVDVDKGEERCDWHARMPARRFATREEEL